MAIDGPTRSVHSLAVAAGATIRDREDGADGGDGGDDGELDGDEQHEVEHQHRVAHGREAVAVNAPSASSLWNTVSTASTTRPAMAVVTRSVADTVRIDPTRNTVRSLLNPGCEEISTTPTAKPPASTTPVAVDESRLRTRESEAMSATTRSPNTAVPVNRLMPMISTITRPGKVAWVSDIVKNERRRSTTCTPTTPASAPAIRASSSPRRMSGESKVWSRPEDCAAKAATVVMRPIRW